MSHTTKHTFTIDQFANLVSQIVDIWKRYSRDTKFIILHEDDTLTFDYDKSNEELWESMQGLFDEMLSSCDKIQERNDIFKVLYASILHIQEMEYNHEILSGSTQDIKNYLERQHIIIQLQGILLEETRTYKSRH
jgi:hypothetical protein